jgi:hypothetical protein
MTTKPKTRKASAAIDPVFAAIAEHKALMRESRRLEKSCAIERDKAEKEHGEWIEHVRRCRSENRSERDWPGEAIISPFYRRWSRAKEAERKAGMRMARTKPATISGAAAMVDHARRALVTDEEVHWTDWAPIALRTAAVALGRMEAA